MKRKYWILWTYLGNYSERPIEVLARSPEDAVKIATGFWDKPFAEKATVYVFDRSPVLTMRKNIVDTTNIFKM